MRWNGSERIVPLRDLDYLLPWHYDLRQKLDSPTWFHWFFNSPLLHGRFESCFLTLHGPIENAACLPRAVYRSPYWSLPRSMPPSVLRRFTDIALQDIHFPSLADLHTLLASFSSLPRLQLIQVTWNSQDTDTSILHKLRIGETGVYPTVHARDCTDDALACMLRFQRPSLAYMDHAGLNACLTLARAMRVSTSVEPVGKHSSVANLGVEMCWREIAYATRELFRRQLPAHRLQLGSDCITVQATSEQAVSRDRDGVAFQVTLSLLCDRTIPLPRVVGLFLNLWSHRDRGEAPDITDCDEDWHFLPNILGEFRSVLASFPHLRVARVYAPLSFFQHAVKIAPELRLGPTLDNYPLYVWTCHRGQLDGPTGNFYEDVREVILDPMTLERSARQFDDLPPWP